MLGDKWSSVKLDSQMQLRWLRKCEYVQVEATFDATEDGPFVDFYLSFGVGTASTAHNQNPSNVLPVVQFKTGFDPTMNEYKITDYDAANQELVPASQTQASTGGARRRLLSLSQQGNLYKAELNIPICSDTSNVGCVIDSPTQAPSLYWAYGEEWPSVHHSRGMRTDVPLLAFETVELGELIETHIWFSRSVDTAILSWLGVWIFLLVAFAVFRPIAMRQTVPSAAMLLLKKLGVHEYGQPTDAFKKRLGERAAVIVFERVLLSLDYIFGEMRLNECVAACTVIATLITVAIVRYNELLEGTSVLQSALLQNRAKCRTSGDLSLLLLCLSFPPLLKSRPRFLEKLGMPSFERALRLHRHAGRFSCVALLAHFIYSVKVYNMKQLSSFEYWPVAIRPGPGLLAGIFMTVLAVTSVFEFFRRYNYTLWYFVHVLMATAASIALPFHIPTLSMRMFLPLVFLHVADWLVWRFDQWVNGSIPFRTTAYATIVACTSDQDEDRSKKRKQVAAVVRVLIPLKEPWTHETTGWNPGTYAMLTVPGVDNFKSHPISITSAGSENELELFVASVGSPKSWSRRLCEIVNAGVEATQQTLEAGSSAEVPIVVRVLGPLGLPAISPERFEEVVFIAGGIGVTPLLSMIRGMRPQRDTATRGHNKNKWLKTKSIHLIWVVREPRGSAFEALAKPVARELELYGNVSGKNRIDLQVHTFITSMKDQQKQLEGLSVQPGRPSLPDMYGHARDRLKEHGKGAKCAVLACGPELLVESARLLACVNNFAWHSESFAW